MKQVNKIPIRLGMSGKYKIMVGKKPGGVESEQRIVTDWFPNLITNGGLEYLGAHSFQNGSVYCQVGTGNTSPTFADTQLASYLANTSTISRSNSVDLITLYQQQVCTYSFGEGVAAGNLTEVGVGWASSDSLFSRALILDSGGSPTTITVLSDEYLTVIYSYRVYGILADSTGSVTFTGDIGGTYGYTLRHSLYTTEDEYSSAAFLPAVSMDHGYNSYAMYGPKVYDGNIGVINALPSGNSAYLYTTDVSYIAATLSSSVIMTVAPSQGNLDSYIKSLTFVLGTWWQVEFDSVIPKTDQDSLSLTFELTWGRK